MLATDATTPEAAAELLASPMSPAELAELAAAEAAIRGAWLGQGEALSRLRYALQAHRNERTPRGQQIATEAGRWRAYLRRCCPDLTEAEAAACMAAWHRELACQHHRAKGPA